MKKIILVFIAIIVLSPRLYAKTTYLAGIEEAVSIAIRNSNELKTVQLRSGITEAQLFTANTILNPVLISDNGLAEKTYRLGLQYIIETGGKRKKRIQTAQLEHLKVQNEVNVKILDIKQKVRKNYVDLYIAQQKEKMLQEMINTIDILLDIVSAKFESGELLKLDVTQIEMIRINAEIELQNAASEIIQAHNNLNLLLGHVLDEKCILEKPSDNEKLNDIEFLSIDEHRDNLKQFQEQASQNRPELQLCANNIELAKKQLEVAKANRIPNLLLAAGPDLVSNSPNTWNVGAFIMGAVEIPVIDRQKGPIIEAMATYNHTVQKCKQEQDSIIYEIKDSYNNIVLYSKVINKYRNELLPRADNLVKQSVQSFEAGKDDVVVPLLAQETLFKTKLAYFKVMSDYHTELSNLERAIGNPL